MDASPVHLSTEELELALDEVLASPRDEGTLRAIFVRPRENQRQSLDEAELSQATGIVGDRWVDDHWQHLPDGSSDPDALYLIRHSCAHVMAEAIQRIVPEAQLEGTFTDEPGGLAYRLLRPVIDLYYEANIIKWETILHPGGDPRKGQKKPPRYVHGFTDLRAARKRLRERKKSSV